MADFHSPRSTDSSSSFSVFYLYLHQTVEVVRVERVQAVRGSGRHSSALRKSLSSFSASSTFLTTSGSPFISVNAVHG